MRLSPAVASVEVTGTLLVGLLLSDPADSVAAATPGGLAQDRPYRCRARCAGGPGRPVRRRLVRRGAVRAAVASG